MWVLITFFLLLHPFAREMTEAAKSLSPRPLWLTAAPGNPGRALSCAAVSAARRWRSVHCDDEFEHA